MDGMVPMARSLRLAPDLRLARMLRAEHEVREGASADDPRVADAPRSARRHAVWRRRLPGGVDGYGLLVDGGELAFDAYHAWIGGMGPFDVRAGGPLPDGMRCAWAVLYVEDGTPVLTLYPHADA